MLGSSSAMSTCYLLGMRERKACQDVGPSAHAEANEGPDSEMAEHVVDLVGQLVHRRVNVAGTRPKHT